MFKGLGVLPDGFLPNWQGITFFKKLGCLRKKMTRKMKNSTLLDFFAVGFQVGRLVSIDVVVIKFAQAYGTGLVHGHGGLNRIYTDVS